MSQFIASPTLAKTGRKSGAGRLLQSSLLYFLMVLVSLFSIGPFLWVLSTSLKPVEDNLYSYPPQLLPSQVSLDSYIKVFDFITWGNVLNSTIIAVGGTIFNLAFCSMAAYPLARYNFPGKRIVMSALLMV